jgi:hypothetical protein
MRPFGRPVESKNTEGWTKEQIAWYRRGIKVVTGDKPPAMPKKQERKSKGKESN